jgi:hypothetical protein
MACTVDPLAEGGGEHGGEGMMCGGGDPAGVEASEEPDGVPSPWDPCERDAPGRGACCWSESHGPASARSPPWG